MRRSCKLVSWGRRSAKASREYHSLVTSTSRNETPLSSFPMAHHQSIVHGSWVKIWADIDFFKGIPRTDSFTIYVSLSCHLSSIHALMLILDHSILSRGLFHRRLPMSPSSRACGTLGDGDKLVCGLDCVAKQKHCVIYSFGLSLLYPLHAAGMVGHMPANPARYIISQASTASRRSSETCCGVLLVARHGDMTIPLSAFVLHGLSWYCGRCPTYLFFSVGTRGLAQELTSKPGPFVRPTSMKRAIIPSIGCSIPS